MPTPVKPHNCVTCGGPEPLYAYHAPGDCITTLRAENERLREALRFYADEEHWERETMLHRNAIEDDDGQIARTALEER